MERAYRALERRQLGVAGHRSDRGRRAWNYAHHLYRQMKVVYALVGEGISEAGPSVAASPGGVQNLLDTDVISGSAPTKATASTMVADPVVVGLANGVSSNVSLSQVPAQEAPRSRLPLQRPVQQLRRARSVNYLFGPIQRRLGNLSQPHWLQSPTPTPDAVAVAVHGCDT